MDEAASAMSKAVEILRESKSPLSLELACTLGEWWYASKNFEKVVEIMDECAQEHLVDGNQVGAANDLHLLGCAYRELKKFDLAIKTSRSNMTVIVDGDVQFEANYIASFLDQIRKGHDLVLPVRTHLIGGPIRRFASKVLTFLCRRMLGFTGSDINGGIRALSRNFINQYISIGQGFRLANPALFYQSRMQNLSLGFVKISPKDRNSGTSFIPWHKPWQLFIESIREIKMIRGRFRV
jgi:hypothetical protein